MRAYLALLCLLVASSALAQRVPPVREQLQNDADDRAALDACYPNAITFNAEDGEFECATGGGGTGCTEETLTRGSPTSYTFAASKAAVEWCTVEGSSVVQVSASPILGQFSHATATITLGWSLPDYYGVVCCAS